MANGTRERPEGTVSLEIWVKDFSVYVNVAVLTINGFDLLLGNNALRQLESVRIDYPQDQEPIFSSKSVLFLVHLRFS